jgi:heptosyltransferase I
MSAAVHTPVVGLYATSNRWRTGPYFSQALVADRYPDAIQNEFGKPIETLRWGQRVRDPQAMKLVTLADVTAKVDIALAPDYHHLQTA